MNNNVYYEPEQEPLIIYPSVLEKIFQYENGVDVLGVFMCYYKTAKYRNTHKVWATVPYIQKWTHLSKVRVQRARKVLLEMKLIVTI